MIFTPTKLAGVFIIDLKKLEDDRGFFARTFCVNEFAENGLDTNILQCNISFNKHKGTVRGMHFQTKPFEEARLVRVIKGSIHDVVIDLRPGSKTFKQQFSIVLTDDNYLQLYIPKGFAHGFQTLEDNTEVFYQMSEVYSPNNVSGVRFNDPQFKVSWPIKVTEISDKDLSYPDFKEER